MSIEDLRTEILKKAEERERLVERLINIAADSHDIGFVELIEGLRDLAEQIRALDAKEGK